MVVAASWLSDAKLMQHVHYVHQGIVLVEGKKSYTFTLADGQKITGHDLIHGKVLRWAGADLWKPECAMHGFELRVPLMAR